MKKILLLIFSVVCFVSPTVAMANEIKLTDNEETHFLLLNEMLYSSDFYFSFNPESKVFSIVMDVPGSNELIQVREQRASDFLVEDVQDLKDAWADASQNIIEKLGKDYSVKILNGTDVSDVFFEFNSDENIDAVFAKANPISVSSEKEQDVPQEYKNALTKAESYATNMFMSKQRVYDQLTSEYGEGFPADAAQYAVDNLDVNWNYNALQKAKSYYETMSMSKDRVYQQLISEYGEQFTPEQAQYAIDNLERNFK